MKHDGNSIATKGHTPQGFQLRHLLHGHEASVYRIAWSPDGRLIASPSEDNTIRIWNTESGELLHTLRGHTDWVYSVALAPNGMEIASASADTTVLIWDLATEQITQEFKKHTDRVFSIAWSSIDNTIARLKSKEFNK